MKRFDAIDNVLNKYKNNLKKLNLTPFDLAELYYDFKQYDKATEYIKQMVEPDIFNYKIQMLKSMEKYEDAIELIISDKNCEKELLINDILNKRPDLKPKYDELIKKSGK
jgi:tetratricopeptide (TPR) repeat protein